MTCVCPSIHPSVCPKGGTPARSGQGDALARSRWAYPGKVQIGGYPSQVQMGGTQGGVPPSRDGAPPSQVQMGYPSQVNMGLPEVLSKPGGTPCLDLARGVPPRRDGEYLTWGTPQEGWGTPARSGWGYPPVRTTEGVLAMRRAVCLLHSCRSTVLFLCSLTLTLTLKYSEY